MRKGENVYTVVLSREDVPEYVKLRLGSGMLDPFFHVGIIENHREVIFQYVVSGYKDLRSWVPSGPLDVLEFFEALGFLLLECEENLMLVDLFKINLDTVFIENEKNIDIIRLKLIYVPLSDSKGKSDEFEVFKLMGNVLTRVFQEFEPKFQSVDRLGFLPKLNMYILEEKPSIWSFVNKIGQWKKETGVSGWARA